MNIRSFLITVTLLVAVSVYALPLGLRTGLLATPGDPGPEPEPWGGLKFTAQGGSCSIRLSQHPSSTSLDIDLRVSYNGGKTWSMWSDIESSPLNLKAGESVCLKAGPQGNTRFATDSGYYRFVFDGSGKVSASGDINSLLSADYTLVTSLTTYCYYKLFENCSALIHAPDLPAAILASYCYESMFSGCTSLTQPPALPATTLASACYKSMFSGCTSLAQPPVLPATTLASECYKSMFSGCSSLESAPVLKAGTLKSSCYSNMFQGCTSLTSTPALPATYLAVGCYTQMFLGCTNLKTAASLPAYYFEDHCYSGMFSGCSSLEVAPLIYTSANPGNYSLSYMFNGCSSLREIRLLDYDGPFHPIYFIGWTSGVSTNGVFYYDGSDTTVGDSAIPPGWIVKKNPKGL